MATVVTYRLGSNFDVFVCKSENLTENVLQSFLFALSASLFSPGPLLRLVLLAVGSCGNWRRGLLPLTDEWLVETINIRQVS